MKSGSAVFLDTSIQICRFFKADDLKRRINERLQNYTIRVTGLVVRNEFRRRVLTQAKYLLNLLNRYGSLKRVQHHVVDQLGGDFNKRKRTVCLEILTTLYPDETDEEHAERAKSALRTLLVAGLDDFDNSVDSILPESGCGCGKQFVKELKPYEEYDCGINSCKEIGPACCIREFITAKTNPALSVCEYLRGLPSNEKSEELTAIENIIPKIVSEPALASELDLCSHVGDFLICLESSEIPDFYTQNGKESQHLCKVLNQTLIVRSNHPEEDDRVCPSTTQDWPKF